MTTIRDPRRGLTADTYWLRDLFDKGHLWLLFSCSQEQVTIIFEYDLSVTYARDGRVQFTGSERGKISLSFYIPAPGFTKQNTKSVGYAGDDDGGAQRCAEVSKDSSRLILSLGIDIHRLSLSASHCPLGN